MLLARFLGGVCWASRFQMATWKSWILGCNASVVVAEVEAVGVEASWNVHACSVAVTQVCYRPRR
jgi:hypothetical protein